MNNFIDKFIIDELRNNEFTSIKRAITPSKNIHSREYYKFLNKFSKTLNSIVKKIEIEFDKRVEIEIDDFGTYNTFFIVCIYNKDDRGNLYTIKDILLCFINYIVEENNKHIEYYGVI